MIEDRARLIIDFMSRAATATDQALDQAHIIRLALESQRPSPEALVARALLDQGQTALGFRQARECLDLTRPQLADLLETDTQTIQRIEMPEDARTARRPATRMIRLLKAYLDGYRPSDWPTPSLAKKDR